MTPRAAGRRLAAAVAGTLLAALAVVGLAPPATAAAPAVIRTVPPIGGVELQVDGFSTRTDARGVANLPTARFDGLAERLKVLPKPISPDLSVEFDRVIGSPRRGYTIGLRTKRLVTYQFLGPDRVPVAPERISSLELRSNTGETVTVSGAEVAKPLWLAASRTQQTPKGLISKDLYWTVSHVTVDGTEVVNKGQQKFVPNQLRDWTVKLLFYQVQVVASDALFGGPAGRTVTLQRPDGSLLSVPLADGQAYLANVPRGDYEVRVAGGGLAFSRPVRISKDQELVLEVITPLDLGLVGSGLAAVALGLVLIGRRQRMGQLRQWVLKRLRIPAGQRFLKAAQRRGSLVIVTIALLVTGLLVAFAAPRAAASETAYRGPPAGSVPILAYYYIWYNQSSWDRAKRDYPLLGRYSSADPEVMRQHVRLAKSAGLTGFLVSWKHTDFLDPRLDQLVALARQQDFKLGIVYQGLDFQRQPLPVPQVAEDLRFLAGRYRGDPVFDLFGKPVVIITGTEQYTVEQLREIVDPVRPQLHVLASAKSVEDYQRTASLVDGDAYYWSSGDPSQPSYRQKLERMGAEVHQRGGLWLAPAPAGFDARDLDGSRVTDRENGQTLRRAVEVAAASAPAAISVISWNEFSENSHIEPSVQHGTTALRTLAAITGSAVRLDEVPVDSSEPTGPGSGLPTWAAMAIGLGGIVLLPLILAAVRRRRRVPPH